MRRYDEGVEKAKSIIDELKVTGELGPIIFARAHCFGGEDYCNIDGYLKTDEKVSGNLPSWSIAPDWLPQQYHQDYAWFLNVYSHNINLLRYLLGETPSVDFVRLDKKNGRVAVLDFDHHVAVLEAGNFSYHSWDEVTEIYFAHGRLKIETPPALLKNVSASIELYKGTSHSTHIYQSGWTWAFRRQAEDFIKCIKGGQIPVTSGDDCLEDMRLIEEMWKMEISRK